MKITREELETRVQRTLDNFYNYANTPGELSRGETQFYYLIRDLRIYKSEGGNVLDFKDSFLLNLLNNDEYREEQVDFICDLINCISGNCRIEHVI